MTAGQGNTSGTNSIRIVQVVEADSIVGLDSAAPRAPPCLLAMRSRHTATGLKVATGPSTEQERILNENTIAQPLRGLRTFTVAALSAHTGKREYDSYIASLDDEVRRASTELEHDGYVVVDVKFTITEEDSLTSYYAMLVAVPDVEPREQVQ